MFDMRSLQTRYFKMKLPNGMFLEIEPPKLKVLRKISELAKIDTNDESGNENEFDDSAITGLVEALSLALSKNRQKKQITPAFIEENLNIDEIQDLLLTYFDWVRETQNAKN